MKYSRLQRSVGERGIWGKVNMPDIFGSGIRGSRRIDLLYKSTLFFVLDEAGQGDGYHGHHGYQRTTVQQDRAVLICGPWLPTEGHGLDLVWTSFGPHGEHHCEVQTDEWRLSV